jgi:hypothetical protein
MRALNFFFIFLICLALVFFSIENTQPYRDSKLSKASKLKAPLCVELIVATGLGSNSSVAVQSVVENAANPGVAPTNPPSSRKKSSGFRN